MLLLLHFTYQIKLLRDSISGLMIVRKLISSEQKKIVQKPQFVKPIYKSYRELLQLDRPKRKISYQSSSSEEDFLEKLLKEERKKQNKSKKKLQSRASSPKSPRRNEKVIQQKQKLQAELAAKQKSQTQSASKQVKPLSEIDLFLQQTKQLSSNAQIKLPQWMLAQEEKLQQTARPLKSKSLTRTQPYQSTEKSKQVKTKVDLAMNNPIFIDTKSVETPPMIYSAGSKLFTTVLPSKHSQGYQQLLREKQIYERQCKVNPELHSRKVNKKIEHVIEQNLNDNFTFQPCVQPMYKNWRMSLTLKPLQNKPKRQFIDRKYLFKNQRQQQMFVNSLRQLSRKGRAE